MKKTATTTKAGAPVAPATEATTSKRTKGAIRAKFLEMETVHAQTFSWKDFLELLSTSPLEIETRYLVTFETLEDWEDFCDLVSYDRAKRTIPGNRDEKPGHAKTLRDKDIPTLGAYDYRRGQASINIETMNLIDHGHRFRVIDDHKTKNPTEPVTIALRFTTSVAAGFDGTQASWTVKDQAKTALLEQMDRDEASFYAGFMQQGGNVIRLRLQGLGVEGGGQSAHKQLGHVLTTTQETRCWDYDPLYIGIWNLTSKNPKTPDQNPTSTGGRTLIEIVNQSELYTQGGKDLQKIRLDLLLLAMVDAVPETFDDYATTRKLLDRLESQLSLIGNAFQPLQTFKHSTEAKYHWMVALWKTLKANHAPKAETIEEYLDEAYPQGLQTVAKKLKSEREEALKLITEKE